MDAFGALYPIIYAHRTVEAAAPEACFAAAAVSLKEEERALDLCCGAGRHLATLRETGARLTGVDYSEALLRLARERLPVTLPLARADMRQLPFSRAFDAIFSFFTSFGYFFEEADNFRCMGAMAGALKPGGRFFMDYLNPAGVADGLQPETERTVGEYRILERRWIDTRAKRVNKTVRVYTAERLLGETSESVRMYEHVEMTAMLAASGLQVHRTLGGYDGAVFNTDSPRMILVGAKATP